MLTPSSVTSLHADVRWLQAQLHVVRGRDSLIGDSDVRCGHSVAGLDWYAGMSAGNVAEFQAAAQGERPIARSSNGSL